MNEQTLYFFEIWQICVIFFIGILFFAYLGYKSGSGFRKKNESRKSGFDEIMTGIVTVLSLLMGFTFSMSGERYQSYKNIMIDEVNSISNSVLYSDLYPEPYRSEYRKYFSEYIEARIDFNNAGTNLKKINDSKGRSDNAGNYLWEITSRLFKDSVMINASRQMSPNLTQMFNAATTREARLRSKVPSWILIMIVIITFLAVYISGFRSIQLRKKELLYLLSFTLVITLVTYIILDLDRPDSGLIKPAVEQEALIELRQNFFNK
jgi:hypothetical protein